MLNSERFEHPAQGMVALSRVQSNTGISLFGSALKHQNVIALRIKTATHDRELSNDWYMGNELIVELYLAPNQLADLLTNMNVGDGVPCTFRYLKGKEIPEYQTIDPELQFQKEFCAEIQKITETQAELVTKAKEILEKPSISKADRSALLNTIMYTSNRIQDFVPFATSQFERRMLKVVSEAKSAVEAFVTSTIHRTGLEAMASHFKGLISSDSEEKNE